MFWSVQARYYHYCSLKSKECSVGIYGLGTFVKRLREVSNLCYFVKRNSIVTSVRYEDMKLTRSSLLAVVSA